MNQSQMQQQQHRQYQNDLFNQQLHEIYLRPLLDKHSKRESIMYEDLIHSWKGVEEWLLQQQQQQQNHQQGISNNKLNSQIIEKVKTIHESLLKEYTKEAQLYYSKFIETYKYESKQDNKSNSNNNNNSNNEESQADSKADYVNSNNINNQGVNKTQIVEMEIKHINAKLQNWVLPSEVMKQRLFYQPLRKKILQSLTDASKISTSSKKRNNAIIASAATSVAGKATDKVNNKTANKAINNCNANTANNMAGKIESTLVTTSMNTKNKKMEDYQLNTIGVKRGTGGGNLCGEKNHIKIDSNTNEKPHLKNQQQQQKKIPEESMKPIRGLAGDGVGTGPEEGGIKKEANKEISIDEGAKKESVVVTEEKEDECDGKKKDEGGENSVNIGGGVDEVRNGNREGSNKIDTNEAENLEDGKEKEEVEIVEKNEDNELSDTNHNNDSDEVGRKVSNNTGRKDESTNMNTNSKEKKNQQQQKNTKDKVVPVTPVKGNKRNLQRGALSAGRQNTPQQQKQKQQPQQQSNKRKKAGGGAGGNNNVGGGGGGGGRGRKSARIANKRTSGGRGRKNKG